MGIKGLTVTLGLIVAFIFFAEVTWGAQSNTRAIIHIPQRALLLCRYFSVRTKDFLRARPSMRIWC